MRWLAWLAAMAALSPFAHAFAADASEGFVAIAPGPADEISDADRERIWREIDAARAKLALPKAGERPAFQWPLRTARGFSDPFADSISNFVDHDATYPQHLQDYNCGTRTYDTDAGYNHRGIDISIWPDSWNLMAAQQVEIVAAAPGTIVSKADGNFDRNCQFNSQPWNAVYVQHDDGSVAWYGHMKSGSVTRKAVGERVAVGEFLGTVGSSGNSTGPHLHFEVYDAGKRLVDPFAGQCNAWNAESWWASQPPYRVTRVNRALTASAAPVASTCGSTGQMQEAGTLNAKSAFKPGDVVYFVATSRDILTGNEVLFTIRRPDGTVWRQRTIASSGDFSASYAWISYTLEATAAPGTWLFEAQLNGTRAQASFDVTATGARRPNYTDLWWNALESGWGINLVHQGDILFATWFTYDADGSAMWLVISDARLQPDGSYAGAISRTTGVPLAQIHGQQASTSATTVGSGVLRFTSAQQATFSYTVSGVSQQKQITRFVFDSAPVCAFSAAARSTATNYQDLWWNAEESGWGINLSHQGDLLFATWFTYGAGGRAQWLFGSEVRRQPTGEFRGRLYRSTGTPLPFIAGAQASTGYSDVGEITLAFSDGEHGRMDYSVDGIPQSKAITRYLFSGPQTLCH